MADIYLENLLPGLLGNNIRTNLNFNQGSQYVTVGNKKSGTDISSDINTALINVSNAGGGIVFIAPGRYPIAQGNYIVPKSNCILMGAGVATELYKTVNDYIIYDSSNSLSYHDFEVNKVMFTGTITNSPSTPTRNRTVSTGGSVSGPQNASAIIVQGSLDTGTGDPSNLPLITNITLKDCIFRNLAALPILLTGITGKTLVTGCEFTNNYDPGFKFNQEIIFSNNHCMGGGDNGVSLSRGNKKVVCVGNTIENTLGVGIWVAGFNGDAGAQYTTISNNVIRACGLSGISLEAGGSYGTISGNFIDKQYYYGGPDWVVSTVYGIYLSSSSQVNIVGNTVKGAPRAGINVENSTNVLVSSNLLMDIGAQFKADGTTAVTSSDTTYNLGVFVNGTASNIQVFNNAIIDSRGTPYCNFAVAPYPKTGLTCFNNTMIGCRNTANLANQFSGGLLQNRTTIADTTYTITQNDYIIEYTSLTTGRTVTLPTAVGITGQEYIIKDGTGGAATNNITIATTSAQTIDGSSTKVINSNYGVVRLYSNGANWLTF